MSRFLKEALVSLDAYIPGEQPQDKKYIKLNTNESPYPPSKLVVERITEEEIGKLKLYSDPTCSRLKSKLAALFRVEKENVFISNGSDEVLSFSFLAFCDGNKGMAFPDISYGFYKVYAELYGVPYERIPLRDDFSVAKEDYFHLNKNIVIANPNAPTGLALSRTEVEEIVTKNDNLVIIDEAYVDFGGESCIPLTKKYGNLLVVGTFSKSRSLAGARLGFAVGNKEIIADLEKVKYSTNPYNINRISQIAGEAAIDDNGYYMTNAARIIETRDKTAGELKRLGFEVIPSKANFIFAKHSEISGAELYLKLKENGILVRHFSAPRIDAYLRITVGTPEEMSTFVETVDRIIGR